MTLALLAGAVALLAYLALPPPAMPRRSVERSTQQSMEGIARFRIALAVLCGVGAWTLMRGVVGILAGVAAAFAALKALDSATSAGDRRRRQRLRDDLPFAVDLLGHLIERGGDVEGSLVVVARAVGGPVGEEWTSAAAELRLATDPAEVWRRVASTSGLEPMGRALARSHRSGASVVAAIRQLADDLVDRAQADAEVKVRSVEVRAAAPLGLCFLPAFVVVGIVPLMISVFARASLW